METKSWIFSETSVASVVSKLRQQWPGRRRPLTLDAMAKALGYKSPRLVAMIEKGQRPASLDFIERLSDRAGLNEGELEYLRLLGRPNDDRMKMLKRENRALEFFETDVFRMMSDWHHLVMLQMITTTHPYSTEKIRRKMKSQLTIEQIEQSKDLLLKLGEIVPDGDGFAQSTSAFRATQTTVPSKARQDHHRAMMDQAQKAMARDLMDNRDFKSYTFRAAANRIAEMKEDLTNFLVMMDAKYWDENSKDVFQLNLQLFTHTRTGDQE